MNQGPIYMPQGLPPGHEYADAERAPPAIGWMRLYAGITCVLYGGAALFGMAMMLSPMVARRAPGSSPDLASWILGLIYTMFAIVFLLPSIGVFAGGRRGWAYTAGTIAVGLGLVQICCLPLTLPLLLQWLRPETRRWFNAY
jgi:hypothetical protein